MSEDWNGECSVDGCRRERVGNSVNPDLCSKHLKQAQDQRIRSWKERDDA